MPERNNWSSWHEKRYVKRNPKEIREFYSLFKKNSFKKYGVANQPGDIIEDVRRNIKVPYEAYECPFCRDIFTTEDLAFKHLYELPVGHPKMTSTSQFIKISEEERIGKALIYYELVRPEEIILLPASVEFPINPKIKEKIKEKAPSEQDRNLHDKQVAQWREDMKKTQGRRKLHLEMMPNGDIAEKGGKDWWYWCPQKLQNGRWIPLEVDERSIGNLTIRVLALIAIIPEEEVFE